MLAIADGYQGAVFVVLALLWDRILGEPPNRFHPVVWVGSLIDTAGNRWVGAEHPYALWGGAALALVVPAICANAGVVVLWLPSWLGWPLHLFLLKASLSLYTLLRAAQTMAQHLVQDDLTGARNQLSWLCSRDPAQLQAPQLAAATIESVAENLSDSVVAPLFYYACFGLPGALAYRAINTADAMLGYRGRLERLGKVPARLDDLANFIPARLTGALLLLAAPVCGAQLRAGLQVARRDAGQTDSPNAGVPMATMAGLLGIELAKENAYCLGAPAAQPQVADIHQANRLAQTAGLLAFALCAIWRCTR